MQIRLHIKQRYCFLVSMATVLGLGALLLFSEPHKSSVENSVLTSLREKATAWVQQNKVVGAEILIIKKGQIIFHEAFGWKDNEQKIPMETDTIFRIRSMTKPMVGTAILMLADQGKIDLKDPVSRYLPSYDNDRSRTITITQLLHHSGGFSDPGYPNPLDSYGSLREAVDALGKKGPETEPGSQFIYSDGGTATLGALVAEIAKMPVERFLERNLIQPLGMTDTMTVLTLQDPRRLRVSCTYELDESNGEFTKYWDNKDPQKLPFFRASGGIYATPIDYAKFLAMWMNDGILEGKRYLSTRKVNEAFSPGKIPQYGMHWNLLWEDSDDDTENRQETLSGFGHLGSDGTLAFAFSKNEIMVFYFSQSRGGSTSLDFLKMVREQLID